MVKDLASVLYTITNLKSIVQAENNFESCRGQFIFTISDNLYMNKIKYPPHSYYSQWRIKGTINKYIYIFLNSQHIYFGSRCIQVPSEFLAEITLSNPGARRHLRIELRHPPIRESFRVIPARYSEGLCMWAGLVSPWASQLLQGWRG